MKTNKKKIILIGSGNVATHLGKALFKKGFIILEVYSRSATNASKLAKAVKANPVTSINKISKEADIYILAVSDEAIPQIAKKIKLKDKLVLHTSGSTHMDILKNSSSNYGVLYPLQTFNKNIPVDFKNVPFFIEASNSNSLKLVQKLTKSLSGKVHQLHSEARMQMHIAAVFACNFTNHLYVIAAAILKKSKLPFSLLAPLIRETTEKALSNEPSKVQTGPASRKDKRILKMHEQALEHSDIRRIYKLLSVSISKIEK